jgi:hypothetical protein
VLQINDQDMNRLVARDDMSSGSVRIAAALPAGRYYLRVANNGGSQSPGTYSVSIKTARLHHVAMLIP